MVPRRRVRAVARKDFAWAMKGIGVHGTRIWNADWMRKSGSPETYYYALTRRDLDRMSPIEIGQRFVNSVRNNVRYWFDKHAITVPDAMRLRNDDLPAIVFVRHKDRLVGKRVDVDRASTSHLESNKPTFEAFSADLGKHDILGSVSIADSEYSKVLQKLRAEGKLDRDNLVNRLVYVLAPKARAFVLSERMRKNNILIRARDKKLRTPL